MRKSLEGLHWEHAWLSQMGCLKACLHYLGRETTWPRLYGLSGQAFVINMHETACPSGPTGWRSAEMLGALLPNLGVEIEFVLGSRHTGDLAEAQARGWEMARRYLDAGHPVYGWNLAFPEYYTISGHDLTGYFYTGPAVDEMAGPKPWRELGDDEIGMFAMAGVRPCPPNSVRASLVDALELVQRFADPADPWSPPGYTRGPAAFEVWATALANGSADEFGHRYCAAVWSECRHYAVQFLKELAEHLTGEAAEAAETALASYRKVANLLGAVSAEHVFLARELVPDKQTLQDDESAQMLHQAGKTEATGMEGLQRLAELLAE